MIWMVALVVTAVTLAAAGVESAVMFAVKERIAPGLKKLDHWNPL